MNKTKEVEETTVKCSNCGKQVYKSEVCTCQQDKDVNPLKLKEKK